MNRLIVFISIVLSFVGCAKESSNSRSLNRPLISLMVDGTFEDKSFAESAWKGIQILKEDFKVDIFGKTSSSISYVSDLEALKDKGSSIIWGVGYKLQEAIEQAALLNRDMNYGAIDIIYKDGVNIPENLLGLSFKVEEASFLAGYLAAHTSKTGKIGFVGGIESTIINAFRYGYESGVKYANKDIKLESQYVGSFVDLSLARTIALKMYKDNIDIIFVAAGLAGLGVIEVAKELGIGHYIIGVDQDQSYLAPENILTSVVRNIGNSICEITKSYLETNIFAGGKILELGLKDDAVGIVKNNAKIEENIMIKIGAIEDKIVSGDILVPSNLDKYKKFLEIHNLLN
ncbi:BMP family ABC transporter substrate-binding protein [Borrelia miyamotoi]|uniref:BMP family protein n=1 Tax=Borrelia miyamotoi TaxID=47466 RepID=A0AAQ2WVT7_9SPIR|nr:BMP family ABC transporter substrate-binding protein [Borrelia miyamotoi]AJA58548.1 basic membrane protein [Borrelia miyamotoi]AOW95626.1 BMP family ABC transporter substrate-binding protein [Borrelia miyamotoi]QTL83510.1 BMP family protein [Borrelia miyamotoi]WAZ85195.1 BMP family protein [Borrelia miyamotoi]WAZ90979.1 BMP family protein [Borrelia miyamotoi]